MASPAWPKASPCGAASCRKRRRHFASSRSPPRRWANRAMTILYLSDPARGAVIRDIFAAELPDMPFHMKSAANPAAVRYMITWLPPANLATAYPNLRLLFSMGAGVDQLDLAQL